MNMKTTTPRAAWIMTGAFLLAAATASIAMAQVAGGGTDVLGAQPVSQTAVLVFKAIGMCGLGYGAVKFMGGGHRIESMTSLAIGGLILGKSSAIATYLGW